MTQTPESSNLRRRIPPMFSSTRLRPPHFSWLLFIVVAWPVLSSMPLPLAHSRHVTRVAPHGNTYQPLYKPPAPFPSSVWTQTSIILPFFFRPQRRWQVPSCGYPRRLPRATSLPRFRHTPTGRGRRPSWPLIRLRIMFTSSAALLAESRHLAGTR